PFLSSRPRPEPVGLAPMEVLSPLPLYRMRTLVGSTILVLCLIVCLPTSSRAEVVQLRSEQAGSDPIRDRSLHMLVGPVDAPFPNPFGPAELGAAASGPAAYLVPPYPTWLKMLPADPRAVWVSDTTTSSAAGSALFAQHFNLQAPFTKATLFLAF